MPLENQCVIQVLICTHNRAELLKRAIHFLNRAERPDHCGISLFVVANACSDDTFLFLQQYQKKDDPDLIPLKWIKEPVPGKSNALNSAIPKLNSAVIAMVDDDHRADENYFVAIRNAILQYPDADFFCGKIIPDWDGSEPHWVHDQGKYRIYPLPVPHFDLGDKAIEVTRDIAVPGGGNLVVKSELFKKIGLFSTELGPVGHDLGGGEDYQWVIRAYNSGAKLCYLPEIIQFHFVDNKRLTTGYLLKKAFERSSSVIRVSHTAQNYSGILFPRYLVKKVLIYFFQGFFTINPSARRFYLVRLAASLGEISGFFKLKKN